MGLIPAFSFARADDFSWGNRDSTADSGSSTEKEAKRLEDANRLTFRNFKIKYNLLFVVRELYACGSAFAEAPSDDACVPLASGGQWRLDLWLHFPGLPRGTSHLSLCSLRGHCVTCVS